MKTAYICLIWLLIVILSLSIQPMINAGLHPNLTFLYVLIGLCSLLACLITWIFISTDSKVNSKT